MVDVTAGRDGRLAAPPKGDIYRRDPEAARAQAIRERVALYQRQGKPVPDHLQHLYDTLPAHEKLDVDLVDETTGEQIAEVEVVGPGRSAAPPEQLAPPPGPFSRSSKPKAEPKPEPVATFERYEVPKKSEPEPLEVEAVELPEPVKAAEPVKPVVAPALNAQGGAGTLGAQAEAIARAAALSGPTPAPKPAPPGPRKQPGRPRKGTSPR